MDFMERAVDERRSAERLHVIVPLDATMNGKAVEIVDLSLGGARLRHWHSVARSTMRLRFTWNGAHFNEPVKLMSSRVVAMSERQTSYETRVAFPAIGATSSDVLQHAVRTLHDRRLATWMANLDGEEAAAPAAQAIEHEPSYVVCTLNGKEWRRRTRKSRGEDPKNGFVVSDTVTEGDIRRLCDAFAAADGDGRELLRLVAHHLS